MRKIHLTISAVACSLILGACNGSGTTDTEAKGTGNGNGTGNVPLTDKQITGKAIDGYLAKSTVCLDLNKDGYCQPDSEPVTSTDENGSFSIKVTKTQQEHKNFGTAPLLVYSGYDSDTKKEFTGKLKARLGDGNTSFITPISTMVASLQDKNKTEAEAKAQISKLLGLDIKDLDKDPVAESKRKPKILKVALKLHKTLEALAKSSTDSTKTKTEIMDELYGSLASVLAKQSAEGNLSKLFDDMIDTREDFDKEKAKNASRLMNEQIDKLIADDDFGGINTNDIGTKIASLGTKIEKEFDNLNAIDLDVLNNKGFILLHAEEILNIIKYSSSDFDALAKEIRRVFVAGGMTDKFLAVEVEIRLLKADAKTKNIGTSFENFIKAQNQKSDNLNLLINSESIAFKIPSVLYDLYTYASNIELQEVHLDTNMTVNSISKVYNSVSKKFELPKGNNFNNNYQEFYLDKNGNWSERKNDNTFSLSTNKKVLTINEGEIKIIKKIDLTTVSKEELKKIQERISHYSEFTMPIQYSKGAIGYLLGEKKFARYLLHIIEINYKNGRETTYSSLNDYFTDNRDRFEGTFDLAIGTSGNIINRQQTFDTSGNTITTKQITGTWKVEKLGNSDKIGLVIYYKGQGQGSHSLYTVYNSKVYYGYIGEADKDFSNHLFYQFNKIAIDDIVKEAKVKVDIALSTSGGSTATPTPSTKQGKLFKYFK